MMKAVMVVLVVTVAAAIHASLRGRWRGSAIAGDGWGDDPRARSCRRKSWSRRRIPVVQQGLGTPRLVATQRALVGERPLASPQVEQQRGQGGDEQQAGTKPEQQRDALDRRTVEDEIAIADDHKVDDFLVADLPAAIMPRISRRRSTASSAFESAMGLVLADQAAQLGRERLQALFGDRVGGQRRFIDL
jgi:hypothetical protein